MIEFPNGHKFEFVSASGAMAYLHGWPWEAPFRWVGLLRPREFTIITKTLTLEPTVGNLKLWCPWRCVRLLRGGSAVNAVGLTNPGLYHWMAHDYLKVQKYGYDVIVSAMPKDVAEAHQMGGLLDLCRDIKGVELNFSCPNVNHDTQIDSVVAMTEAFAKRCRHPLVVKLSYADPYLQICERLDGKVSAFDLINTIPWGMVYGDTPSPLKKNGLVGGVSGPDIAVAAGIALTQVRSAGLKTPVISGGGIDSYQEVANRFHMGAGAVAFGTMFIRTPWKPNQIIRQWKKDQEPLTP